MCATNHTFITHIRPNSDNPILRAETIAACHVFKSWPVFEVRLLFDDIQVSDCRGCSSTTEQLIAYHLKFAISFQ